jgi:protein-tyrosine phosphatase
MGKIDETPAAGEAYRILFVCSGNTCRSPMAGALARSALAERGWDHVEIRSAGSSAQPGFPASRGARRAAARGGLDLEGHGSTPLARDLVDWADLILTMSPHHLLVAGDLGGEGKSMLLTEFAEGTNGEGPGRSIPDPFGGDDSVYDATFQELRELVGMVLDRLAPLLAP